MPARIACRRAGLSAANLVTLHRESGSVAHMPDISIGRNRLVTLWWNLRGQARLDESNGGGEIFCYSHANAFVSFYAQYQTIVPCQRAFFAFG